MLTDKEIADLRKIFASCDLDGDGYITFEEFRLLRWAALFAPRCFGILPRCGPAGTSLCRRSVHAPHPCARAATAS